MKISKKLRLWHFVLTAAFAVMGTKLAAIGQEIRESERKPVPASVDKSVGQSKMVNEKPASGKIRLGRINRISSKSHRNAEVPAPDPNRSFEVRLVSVTGKDLDSYLNENFEPLRTADARNAWIVDLEPVLDAASSSRRHLIHQAPTTSAADGESLNIEFRVPVTTVKYDPVQKDGKVRAVMSIPQTTEFGIRLRLTGISGKRSTRIETAGTETMPKTIEQVLSPLKIEVPNSRPHGVSETVVTSQTDTFEAAAGVPDGKSLVIKLGRTIEQTDDNLFIAAYRLANRKLWNEKIYPYVAMQRYLIVTPSELP